MAVHNRGHTMGCPTRVSNRNLGEEGFRGVDVRFRNAFAEPCNLADLLEEDDLVLLVAVDANTCRIISTVFKTRQAVAKRLADGFAVLEMRMTGTVSLPLLSDARSDGTHLLYEITAVCKDSAHCWVVSVAFVSSSTSRTPDM